MTNLRSLLASLAKQGQLPVRYREHPLRGIWKGYHEAHLEFDWLITYRIQGDEPHLVRTGTRSDRFGE